ncbi:MAG: hypothetical protein IT175_07185 [Acidobacteria bacterium]|nr:hypothetical protein [Acidobacteriota bacterium]
MLLPEQLVDCARAVILLTDFQAVVHYRDGSGTCTRPVSLESVRAAFSALPVDCGWLDSRVRRVGFDCGRPFLVASIPGGVRSLWIEAAGGDLRIEVPMPPLVFFGSDGRWRVWAVTSDTFSPDLEAFHAPLPNLGDDGGICWGANGVPDADPRSLDAALDLFWASPFSGHGARWRVSDEVGDVRQVLVSLQGAARFPLDRLVPTGSSIGTLVDSLLGRRR